VLVQAYGLFWRAEEIDWSPGAGRSAEGVPRFALLGRRGANTPSLRMVDFRAQHGVYILYGDLGPYYAGIVTHQGLGTRLKQHRQDRHRGKWDRFSWFGFRRVLKQQNASGLQELGQQAAGKYVEHALMVREMEALLIRAMALRNVQKTRFPEGERWEQVRLDEREHYLSKLAER